jgi:nucleolar protein 56
LTIAARVDYFSGEFIGPTLVQDLERRVEDIKSSFPEPSELQLKQQQKKRPMRKPSFRGKYTQKKDQRRQKKGHTERRKPRKSNDIFILLRK